MFKIVVFGFYGPDQARQPAEDDAPVSPVDTETFMRLVWEMEPPETRIGSSGSAPCFVKLTGIASEPVYVQSLSNRMAPGAGLLRCDGYVAIIDAVKILAPRTIQSALRRIADLQPAAHVIIAAGRQNEPDALSSDEIREVLGLHPDLPVYPYVPTEPKTVQRLIRRLARYIDDPQRIALPIFAGAEAAPTTSAPLPAEAPDRPVEGAAERALPQVHGIAQVGITVGDLTRSLDFYRGLLGFRILGQFEWPQAGLTITHLDAGRTLLELVSGRKPAPDAPAARTAQPGARHITLRVTDLDAIVEQLVCADVPLIHEPAAVMEGVRLAAVADPDGTPVLLLEGNIRYTRR